MARATFLATLVWLLISGPFSSAASAQTKTEGCRLTQLGRTSRFSGTIPAPKAGGAHSAAQGGEERAT